MTDHDTNTTPAIPGLVAHPTDNAATNLTPEVLVKTEQGTGVFAGSEPLRFLQLGEQAQNSHRHTRTQTSSCYGDYYEHRRTRRCGEDLEGGLARGETQGEAYDGAIDERRGESRGSRDGDRRRWGTQLTPEHVSPPVYQHQDPHSDRVHHDNFGPFDSVAPDLGCHREGKHPDRSVHYAWQYANHEPHSDTLSRRSRPSEPPTRRSGLNPKAQTWYPANYDTPPRCTAPSRLRANRDTSIPHPDHEFHQTSYEGGRNGSERFLVGSREMDPQEGGDECIFAHEVGLGVRELEGAQSSSPGNRTQLAEDYGAYGDEPLENTGVSLCKGGVCSQPEKVSKSKPAQLMRVPGDASNSKGGEEPRSSHFKSDRSDVDSREDSETVDQSGKAEHDREWAKKVLTLVFAIDSGDIKSVTHHHTSNSSFYHFTNGKLLQWVDAGSYKTKARWVTRDGSFEDSDWFGMVSETSEIKDLLRADQQEFLDLCRWSCETFGKDPLLFSDFEIEAKTGYWRYLCLSYLDPPPGRHDLLTWLYREEGCPRVETEEEREAFRVLWESLLGRVGDEWDVEAEPRLERNEIDQGLLTSLTPPEGEALGAGLLQVGEGSDQALESTTGPVLRSEEGFQSEDEECDIREKYGTMFDPENIAAMIKEIDEEEERRACGGQGGD